jgi:Arc/MetJ-type ribon-helix-helix transcriptional regulator
MSNKKNVTAYISKETSDMLNILKEKGKIKSKSEFVRNAIEKEIKKYFAEIFNFKKITDFFGDNKENKIIDKSVGVKNNKKSFI